MVKIYAAIITAIIAIPGVIAVINAMGSALDMQQQQAAQAAAFIQHAQAGR